MKLTTKSRYAVMAVVEVAHRLQSGGNQVPTRLIDISTSQDIPLSYLEQIFLKLKNANIVKSIKGPGGGYLLGSETKDISVISIVDAVDENTKMTRCGNGRYCTKSGDKCKTHDLWKGLGMHIRSYLSSVSIADILAGNIDISFV